MRQVRFNFSSKPSKTLGSTNPTRGGMPGWFLWILAVVLLLSAGITYRVVASHLKLAGDTAIRLPVPLSTFPSKIGNWVGSDLSIPSTTKEYMEQNFADDFLSRRYINMTANTWVDVYIVYCSSRPGGILGHQPRVCYPAHGWIHDSTESSLFISRTGQQINCLIHRFHKPAPAYEQTVVLNFYILNGQITTEEKGFSGLLGRRPNIAGDPARYVAQVQISSVLENSTRTAATEMADVILDFLPDKDGKVKAAEFIQISPGSNVKSGLSGNN
jgi:hypothetical protein